MHAVEGLLAKVSPDSLDAAAAADLLKRIRENRARMEQASKERETALAEARTPPSYSGRSVSPPPPPPTTPSSGQRPPPPVDAGPASAPSAGMSTRDFTRMFGDCFEPAGPVEVNGRGTRDSFTMVDTSRCRSLLPGMVNSVVLADSQTVLGVVPKTALTRVVVDGGAPPAPPDAGG
jgi:hypothetical protein